MRWRWARSSASSAPSTDAPLRDSRGRAPPLACYPLSTPRRPPSRSEIEAAPESLEDEDILEMVNASLVPATIVDSFDFTLIALECTIGDLDLIARGDIKTR